MSLRSFLHRLLNVRCPLCGARLRDEPVLCEGCASGSQVVWRDGAASLGWYEEPLAGLIRELKYRGRTVYGPALGEALGRGVRRLGAEADAIVPVPVHWLRRLNRGFNQSELIGRGVGRVTGWPVRSWLKRTRNTRHQQRLGREERLSNLAGAFAASAEVAGRRVLLVDDVQTTGATLRECAEALKAAGAASVTVATLAVTHPAHRARQLAERAQRERERSGR